MRVVPGSKFVSFTGGELTLATNWAIGLGAITHLTGPTDQDFLLNCPNSKTMQINCVGSASSAFHVTANGKNVLYGKDTGLPSFAVGTTDPGGTAVTGLAGSLSPAGHFHGPSSVGSIIISGPGGQQLSFIDSDGAANVKWIRAGALNQVLNFESLTDAGGAKHTILALDGDNGRVGVQKPSPNTELDVAGTVTGTNDGKVYDTVPDTGNASLGIYTKVVDHTTNGGAATETVTNFFPAGAVPIAVTALVTTIVAGAGLTTWDIGDAVDDNLWGDSLALAAGTSTDATSWSAAPYTHAWNAAASDLILTANAGQFDSGVVRLTLFYTLPTAPTT